MIGIRRERSGDEAAIFEINRLAFETELEAGIVDGLRLAEVPLISVVAQIDDRIVGHLLFSPVMVDGQGTGLEYAGLAPMAVHPNHQRRGIGSQLVRAGLEMCREEKGRLVFVLGHPDYYPRFGFQPAAEHGLHFVDPELDPYFFVIELENGALDGASGAVEYHELFAEEPE